MKHAQLFFGLILAVAILGLTGCKSQKTSFVTIGTGGVTGVYYPTGGAIASILNKQSAASNIRASVESTAGSVFNTNAILQGDLEFGIVQSDVQYQAYKGQGAWSERGAQSKLRAILSLHAESITLVAATDSGISDLQSMKGKRVNIGVPGSGQYANAQVILAQAGLDWKKDFQAEELKPAEAPKFLQDSRIDAFFYTVGHPSGAITEATSGKRKVGFVPITGMQALIKASPYYAESFIPAALYPQSTGREDTPTIGVKATLVSSSDVSEALVYQVTKAIFDNLAELKTLHPALAQLAPNDMLKGLSAPLHAGSLKYYQEIGLR